MKKIRSFKKSGSILLIPEITVQKYFSSYIYSNCHFIQKHNCDLKNQQLGFTRGFTLLINFKYQMGNIVNEKVVNNAGLNHQDKDKVYKDIQVCLKTNLKKQLDAVVENNPSSPL